MATAPEASPPGYTAAILTVSDGVAAGRREDRGSVAIRELLPPHARVVDQRVVPDDREAIAAVLVEWCERGIDFIATTGGTGLGPRDVTPEATRDVIEREIPGIAEAMRATGMASTPMAMLSRAIAGTRGGSLIVNLPGSPRGVRECLAVVLPVVEHALHVMRGGGH